MTKLQFIVQERIQRLNQLIGKIPLSIQKYNDIYQMDASAKIMVQQKELHEKRDAVNSCLLSMCRYEGDTVLRDPFLNQVAQASQNNDKHYIHTIQTLDLETKQMGTEWLQGIVNKIHAEILEILPSFR